MDIDDIMGWVFGIFLFCTAMCVPALVGFLIYKEVHCWGLDPKTAPIECQTAKTVNFNGDFKN